MAEREFSICVFGATGYTGAKVLAELLRGSADANLGRYAAAGRSRSGLQSVVEQLGATTRVGVVADVNVNDYNSVLAMCKRARLYGEVVVRACEEAGTHYVDVCGEPEFIERMDFKYGAQAAAAGCYLASACGFDSIPGDWGTVMAQREFKAPAVPSSVEMYLTLQLGPTGYAIHYATWQSAVLGLGSVPSLRHMRSEVKAAGKAPNPQLVGPRPKAAAGLDYCGHTHVKAWNLPFPGADASVVRRTQGALTALGQPAVHCVARFTLPSRYYAYVAVMVGGLMALLAKSSFGRALLLRYPSLFSYGLVTHEGPTDEQMRGTKCVTTLVAKGYRNGVPASNRTPTDCEIVMQMVAPDPGYTATSIFVTQAALAVLEEPTRLPPPGVHTPGMLLKDTTYAARLQSRGITFTKLSDTCST